MLSVSHIQKIEFEPVLAIPHHAMVFTSDIKESKHTAAKKKNLLYICVLYPAAIGYYQMH